jgi:hypothetical protein
MPGGGESHAGVILPRPLLAAQPARIIQMKEWGQKWHARVASRRRHLCQASSAPQPDLSTNSVRGISVRMIVQRWERALRRRLTTSYSRVHACPFFVWGSPSSASKPVAEIRSMPRKAINAVTTLANDQSGTAARIAGFSARQPVHVRVRARLLARRIPAPLAQQECRHLLALRRRSRRLSSVKARGDWPPGWQRAWIETDQATAPKITVILVDTSVGIQHLRSGDKALAKLLDTGSVLLHPFVLGELALCNLSRRDFVSNSLQDLPQASVATCEEVLDLIRIRARHRLRRCSLARVGSAVSGRATVESRQALAEGSGKIWVGVATREKSDSKVVP